MYNVQFSNCYISGPTASTKLISSIWAYFWIGLIAQYVFGLLFRKESDLGSIKCSLLVGLFQAAKYFFDEFVASFYKGQGSIWGSLNQSGWLTARAKL